MGERNAQRASLSIRDGKISGALMQASVVNPPVSKGMLWSGRIVTAVVILFMVFDGGIKVVKLAPAVEGTTRLGYPVGLVVPIGIVALCCTLLYAVPKTSILGAILLTGYMGGATATQVRMEDPWFFFPVLIGALAWLGIFLRDQRLRRLIPLRKS
jgi:DoxX-like family